MVYTINLLYCNKRSSLLRAKVLLQSHAECKDSFDRYKKKEKEKKIELKRFFSFFL